MKKVICIIVIFIAVFNWQRAITPESTHSPEEPIQLQAFGEYQSVVLKWETLSHTNITGYAIYWGTQSQTYNDTLFVNDTNLYRVIGLRDNTQYYFAVATFNEFGSNSHLSPEATAITYFEFDGFDQADGPLNPQLWHSLSEYITPVSNHQVLAAEVEKYMGQVKKSFGQYRISSFMDNCGVECLFKLGLPNVGGGGVMLKSEKARSERYNKGYHAYLFWTGLEWELRLEENSRLLAHVKPVLLDSDPLKLLGFVKISLQKKEDLLTATVHRISDYSERARIEVQLEKDDQPPLSMDSYCGFYTCQYGGNTIIVDNFGVRNVM